MKKLALTDLVERIRHIVPDASDDEVAAAAAVQWANDNKHVMPSAAIQLVAIINFLRNAKEQTYEDSL